MKDIQPSDIEKYVDDRLANMQKRPLMWGNPESLEMQCVTLLEFIENFCVEGPPRHIFGLGIYQVFRNTVYPKCPGPAQLSWWLVDEKYGLGMDLHDAAQAVMDFYVKYREYLKMGK